MRVAKVFTVCYEELKLFNREPKAEWPGALTYNAAIRRFENAYIRRGINPTRSRGTGDPALQHSNLVSATAAIREIAQQQAREERAWTDEVRGHRKYPGVKLSPARSDAGL